MDAERAGTRFQALPERAVAGNDDPAILLDMRQRIDQNVMSLDMFKAPDIADDRNARWQAQFVPSRIALVRRETIEIDSIGDDANSRAGQMLAKLRRSQIRHRDQTRLQCADQGAHHPPVPTRAEMPGIVLDMDQKGHAGQAGGQPAVDQRPNVMGDDGVRLDRGDGCKGFPNHVGLDSGTLAKSDDIERVRLEPMPAIDQRLAVAFEAEKLRGGADAARELDSQHLQAAGRQSLNDMDDGS